MTPPQPEPAPDQIKENVSTQRTTGFVMLGVGAAGLLVGSITGGLALGKHSDITKTCLDGHCPAEQRADLEPKIASYDTMGTLSTIGFIAGGALAATGAVLILTAPKKTIPQATVTPLVGLRVHRGEGGVLMNKMVRAWLLLMVSCAGASACTSLLGGFDFDEPTGGSGRSMTAGTGNMMTGSTGGMVTTSTSGAGGSGGTTSTSTGGVTCVDPVKDCSVPANECVTAICDGAGKCGTSNVTADIATTTQTAGDCKKVVCDGNGATKSIDDNADINDDAKECTTDTCAAGVVVHTPVAMKTACGAPGASTKCDAAGECVGCVDASDCGAAPACKVATCNAGKCGTNNAADASACGDSNKCTQTDSCLAGACVGSNPIVCTATDQCHDPGTCAPATGYCSQSVPKGDGSACNDGSKCTKSDSCLAGVCTGSTPVMCPVPDQCHDVAACVAATGLCPVTPKADNTSCDDGDKCTTTDACQAGVCDGTAVVCTALDECHNIGTCVAATGLCLNPNKADGTPCANGTKTCMAGVCQ